MAHKVLLATPTASDVTVKYASSLAKLIEACCRSRPEIQIKPKFLQGAVIHRMRNVLANLAVCDGYTHLLFVDSDIGYEPSAVLRLIDANYDVSGCLCPARGIIDQRWHAASRRIDDPAMAKRAALTFVSRDQLIVHQINGRTGYEVQNGFVQIQSIGMGITLIKVNALHRIAKACSDIHISDKGPYYGRFPLSGPFVRYFDPVVVSGRDTIDEDYAFCSRWTHNCGGKIYALLDEDISHIGETIYCGKALDALKD